MAGATSHEVKVSWARHGLELRRVNPGGEDDVIVLTVNAVPRVIEAMQKVQREILLHDPEVKPPWWPEAKEEIERWEAEHPDPPPVGPPWTGWIPV